jgi:adenine-specific DNA-methyltransferase
MAIDKNGLIEKLNTIEGLTSDERSALLDLLRSHKKYGLVWEDKPEEVEERLRSELPVLVEDKEKFVPSDNPDAPNHILIEGDNLEALTTLAYTHEGKIDVIYIDPPYNTGNKDFIYNDSYVDKEDSYRHSKWLSFMSKRLKLAKQLLSDKGVIFISIDDNEQANLKLLCDEIFGLQNMVSCFSWQANPGGNKSDYVETTLQYVIAYSKNKSSINDLGYFEDVDASKYNLQDEYGKYRKGSQLEKWGNDDTIHTHPNLAYSIYYNPQNQDVKVLFDYNQSELNLHRDIPIVYMKPSQELISAGYYCIRPRVTNVGEGGRWRVEPKTFFERLSRNSFIFERQISGYRIYEKDRCKNQRFIKAKDFISSDISKQSADDIVAIFGSKVFSYPKPVSLVKYLLFISARQNTSVLDFFAGSGTTLHATMQLNAEDGGNRKCILVTNNENGICENVTYERNKRVINGYTKPNGESVEGLKDNNLRYYRTSFVGRSRATKNMRQLMSLATDMLCIKEDLYTKLDKFGELPTHPKVMRYFAKGNKSMLVIYYEGAIPEIVEQIEKLSPAEPIKVYVFSPSEDPWEEDFEFVNDKVELCALPAAIYNTYKRILPKKKDERVDIDVNAKEPEQPKGESTLFDLFEEGGEQ